jgi:hypothetical protein
MDNGVPLASSFVSTSPMMFTHSMGENPPIFQNGMQNYDAQSAPWVSNHFPVDMSSLFQSSPWSTYMSPSIVSGGAMTPMPTSSFDMSHVPQPTLTQGGWNLPSYGSNPSYAMSRRQYSNGCVFYLLHPIQVSFICHAFSFEHFSNGGSTYVPRSFIWGASVLWFGLPSSWNPFTRGQHISSLE